MAGETGIHPLDEQLRLPARSYSYEVQRRLVKKSIQGPFAEAVEAIYEMTGVKVPQRSAEEIVIDASVDFESFYAARQGEPEFAGGPILVSSIDGKGIPMVKSELAVKRVRKQKGEKDQKKKMATVAAVFTQMPYLRTVEDVVESLFAPENKDNQKRKKDFGPERKRVWASLRLPQTFFINNVNEEMNRRDPHRNKLRVVVTDGARGLQHSVARIIKDAVYVLDLLHVVEYLWAAGHALYGEESSEAVDFVRQRTFRILSGEVSQVVKGMRQIATKRNLKKAKRDKLLGAANYFYRNKSRMRYDEYLKKGFPIASGSVEGACKNLIKDRMERSGMRWTARMAEAILKMRATYLSDDFEEYWNYHIIREQERMYPKNRWEPKD